MGAGNPWNKRSGTMNSTITRVVDEGDGLGNVQGEVLDASGVHYKVLNRRIRALAGRNVRDIEIRNVYGQRYLGTNLWGIDGRDDLKIQVHGTPGSDLGAFMDGGTIEIFGNVQDATGNTMNAGRIIIHGSAGDVLGYGMRGGEIYVRGNVGYRVGIHMKEYKDMIPTVVIGGTIQDFFGEYMAGGRVIVLNKFFDGNPPLRQSYFIGTGMHGGSIFIRGTIEAHQMGSEVGVADPTDEEYRQIREYVGNFCRHFNLEEKKANLLKREKFRRLYPKSSRPYGRLYAY
jgi:glutamate synthase domain-containing protein 3